MKRISIALATAYYLCLVAEVVSATTPPPTGFVDASTYGGGYDAADADGGAANCHQHGHQHVGCRNGDHALVC